MYNAVAAAFEPIQLSAVLAAYAELCKLRVNSLVILTSRCAAYLADGYFHGQASSISPACVWRVDRQPPPLAGTQLDCRSDGSS